MSVAQYYPFNGAKDRIRMGLNPIPTSEWIQYENDFSARITEKKNLIQSQRNRVLQSIEGSQAAQNELLENIISFIKKHQNELFTVKDNIVTSHSDNNIYDLSEFDSNPLELISYLAPDDFCILKQSDNDYRLVAASVCAPTYWELTEKIGRPMQEVHAPIATLEEKIGRMIRHFFTNLKPEDYFQRSNWFLSLNSDLPLFKDNYGSDIDIGEINSSNIENKLYLRCERQTFRKLTQTKHIAFGIKIYVSPLSIVKQDKAIAEDLIKAINAMTQEQKNLFGIDLYEEVLIEYLSSNF